MAKGRPTKLTPAVEERILKAIAAGNTLKDAAAYAGIGYSTLEHWLADPRPRYRQFRQAVEQKQAEAVVRNVAIIEKAAQEQWQAAAWWLERRRPDDWGRKERVEHATAPGKPMEVRHGLTDDLTPYVDAVARVLGAVALDHAEDHGAGQPVDPGAPDAETGGVPDPPGA